MTRTTMSSTARGLARMPYLTPRELDGVLDDIDAGELIPIMDEDTGTIAALAIEEVAESLTTDDGDRADYLTAMKGDLRRARAELVTLVTILGEVLAEDDPLDHFYKIEGAAADARGELDSAIENAEEL